MRITNIAKNNKINIRTFFENGKEFYSIEFSYDTEIISLIKKIPGSKWNPEKRFWYIEKSDISTYSIKNNLEKYSLSIFFMF